MVVGFSEQDIASHLSSKLWKISMFVFGSNENFKICFWYLLTFSIYIFVNLQFSYFSYSLTQYLAHRIQHPIPNPENLGFAWSKNFTSFAWIFVPFFHQKQSNFLRNREKYNITSEKYWTHCVMPWQSCLRAQQHQFKIIFKGIKPNHD